MEIIFPAGVALLTQFVKQTKWFDSQWKTLGLVLILSLLGAYGYTALVDAGYWGSALNILAYAGAIYTFIIRRFEA